MAVTECDVIATSNEGTIIGKERSVEGGSDVWEDEMVGAENVPASHLSPIFTTCALLGDIHVFTLNITNRWMSIPPNIEGRNGITSKRQQRQPNAKAK